MPFTVSDFHDLVELLEQNPSWRAEIRRLVLSDDILRLPKTVEDLVATVERFVRSTEERSRQIEKMLADLAASHRELAASHQELVAAQRRTEQRVDELAAGQQELIAAQRRTEQRVDELAAGQQELVAAQRRTEQRVDELAAGQQELVAAQRRTEQRVDELAAGQQELAAQQREFATVQKRTSEHVARLEAILGVTVEDEAAAVLRVVLEEKGYRILAEAVHVRLNGDVDVAHQVEDPQGRRLWAVLEAKARLGWQAVEAWSKRMRSAGFRAALREAGVEGPFLVYVYGMRADLSARKAAEKFGVGLLSSQGEILPPAGEIPA